MVGKQQAKRLLMAERPHLMVPYTEYVRIKQLVGRRSPEKGTSSGVFAHASVAKDWITR